MNINNKKCPASADGHHKPDPAWTRSDGRQVATDDLGEVVETTLICVACHATGVVRARIEDAVWTPEG